MYITDPDLDGDANESYVDWRIGLLKEILGITLDVSYWDAEDEESLCGAPDRRIAGAPSSVQYLSDSDGCGL